MDHSYANQEVYIRHTNLLEYTAVDNNYPGTAGFIHVFSGTLDFDSGSGIYTFPFNINNFIYNGTQAIEVLFINGSGSTYSDGFEFHRTDLATTGPFIGKYWSSNFSLASAQSSSTLRRFNLALQFNNAGSPCFYPLPVELSTANVQCEQDAVFIEWSTITETNNQFFEIELSRDGETWRKVGEVLGAGTTTEEQHYSFDLSQFVSGELSYVRLSQTDYDGTYEMLRVLSVNCSDFKKEQVAYPNPFIDKLSINTAIEPNHIELVDLSGRSIELDYTYDLGKCQANTQSIESGVYMLRLHFDDEITALKVVKL